MAGGDEGDHKGVPTGMHQGHELSCCIRKGQRDSCSKCKCFSHVLDGAVFSD